jgi:aminoglycoside phosphotransferase (APT) family kinase protein
VAWPGLLTTGAVRNPDRYSVVHSRRHRLTCRAMPHAMHADEVLTDAALVRRLVDHQFPQWADLPVTPIDDHGTDHLLYRLGDDLLIRMPRIAWAADQAELEGRWLPVLAPHLPLALPEQVALGEPALGYPFRWSVVRWFPGEVPGDGNVDLVRAAGDLAAFIRALQEVDASGAPRKGGTSRGAPLANLADVVDEHLKVLEGEIDGAHARRVYEVALEAGPWPGAPTWLHGDLQAGNLIVRDRRLTAVIDWGGLGVGDPSCEYAPAWSLFTGESRQAFREATGVDDATWARARAWVLIPALTGLPYYRDTFPAFAEASRYRIAQVLADV